MISMPIITITFFRFRGSRRQWWGFKQMGLAPRALQGEAGLQFVKMLGSGGGNGFSIWPNFGVYGLLGVWDNEDAARQFFAASPLYAEFVTQSAEQWTLFLQNAQAHGRWDGREPFAPQVPLREDLPICVLTRATIRWNKLWHFWRFVPGVSKAMWREHHEGLHFSIGIGELPLVQQATFSLWSNRAAMQAYAYRGQHHQAVMRKTRELDWYSEELFARFHPFDSQGIWAGSDPLVAARQLNVG
jgi:hypothetical protein